MLGIVGGLGPRATVAFYASFMNAVTRQTEGRLPRVLMYSVAMNPQIENSFLQGAVADDAPSRMQVRQLLTEAVEHFLANGVTTVVMPCNTLQDELMALCRERDLPLLNMIELTTQRIVQTGIRRVLVLGTASTYCDGLYARRLQARGVECVYPSAAQQDFVETYIRFALDCNLGADARQRFTERVSDMAQDTSGIVLACTDLSGDVATEVCGKPVFDSLQLLANAAAAQVVTCKELFV